MKLEVFIKVIKEKITCICLRENKRCERKCEKGIVYYEQYEALKKCFKNERE